MSKKLFYLLIGLLLFVTNLHADLRTHLADNFTKGIKDGLVNLINSLNPVFILIGSILILYSVYKLLLDDNPQNRGVSRIFGSISILLLGLIIINLKNFFN